MSALLLLLAHRPTGFADRLFRGRQLTTLCAALVVLSMGCEPYSRPPAHSRGATRGLVVSVSQPASQAGLQVLERGGNAVDAAVATALALAVTYPEAGNIGGGGFMLVYPGHGKPAVCIDYRECAPAAASATMYAGQSTRLGHNVVGVPGTVRGLALAHQQYGKLPWKDLVAPAIRLAADGFVIDPAVTKSLNSVLEEAVPFSELVRVFGKPDRSTWQAGDRLIQPDLAHTLQRLADDGPDAFYTGPIAQQIVAEMQSGGGLITAADLAGYQAKAREPIHGTFRGYDLYAPPPPSSGGIALVEMLNMLETFDLARLGRWSPEANHLIIESMRRAYRDRAEFLGDSDFVSIPGRLTEKPYAQQLAATIDRQQATSSASLAGDIPLSAEGPHTTHFSILDADGMAVANTYTLEQEFGARVVVRGAGFVLNNEMADFNWRPGITDRHGAIGTPPNQIAPGKRMLSAQSPAVVSRDGQVVLVTGTPGGRTIINTVLCVVLNLLEFQMQPADAINAPRLHQPWFPDRVQFEGVDDPKYADLVAALRKMGHEVTLRDEPQGDAHSILVRDGRALPLVDPRISGYAAEAR